MKISVDDNIKINVLQKAFTHLFPYLRLELFRKHAKIGTRQPNRISLQPNITIAECRTTHNSLALTITPQMTVADLKQSFMDIYGLSADVLRLSGKSWLEVTRTEGWTLQKQNQQGEELSGLE